VFCFFWGGIRYVLWLGQAYSNAGCVWGACAVPVNESKANAKIEVKEVKAEK
jgi:hypothetical protein